MGGWSPQEYVDFLVDRVGVEREKAFHDGILRQGNMPITPLRRILGRQKLTRDTTIDWKFYGQAPR